MKTYLITKTQGAPDWSKIPAADIDTLEQVFILTAYNAG